MKMVNEHSKSGKCFGLLHCETQRTGIFVGKILKRMEIGLDAAPM